MAADKRDYYEVLGVGKDASEDEIKKHTEKKQSNITPTSTLATKPRRKNSKRQTRHMKSSAIRIKRHAMTNSVMQALTRTTAQAAATRSAADFRAILSAAESILTSVIFSQAFSAAAAQAADVRTPTHRGAAKI